MAYAGLFLAAFLAATLVPAQSEAILVGLILSKDYSIYLLVLVATAGNCLGSLVNWYLGRYLEYFRESTWFPVSEASLSRAQNFYQRYGAWSVLLSWVPIIGDPLTLIAGLMRMPFLEFMLLIILAKGGRYIMLAWLTLS
ncbi:YqaA family protein [uncultured Thiothrix sp.]|uniref:YqaA family protein n=1 Tax=uncultured Thiothrix sp. TaxID=223185 RepID=UPI002623B590|nr:YqaA family protein [uncultured Thiothrix sp.]